LPGKYLLIDFGSTFTKLTAVDLTEEKVLATAQAHTTVGTNIMEGLEVAYRRLLGKLPQGVEFHRKIACSSAAGGLKMVALGVVPDLTATAARLAALGAGARVMKVYSHRLTKGEIAEIEALRPDIVLLAGGTDGGNREVILHNAAALAGSDLAAPVVVAGNKEAADEVEKLLHQGGKDVRVTSNVLPGLGQLNIDPARQVIREVFMEKIVAAKGLAKAQAFLDGILMPTPAAVLRAAAMLAGGDEGEAGLGELLVVDVGGATTDVHSLAKGLPSKGGVVLKGLAEPFAKRTVEGDLGLRYSAPALLETVGASHIGGPFGLRTQEVEDYVVKVSHEPDKLPGTQKERQLDTALGYAAVEKAVARHAGKIEVLYTPFGATYLQHGKDLTGVKYVIGTGGVIVNHPEPASILRGVLFREEDPTLLKPLKVDFMVDRRYLLAAMGLLAESNPAAALRMMKKYLVKTQ